MKIKQIHTNTFISTSMHTLPYKCTGRPHSSPHMRMQRSSNTQKYYFKFVTFNWIIQNNIEPRVSEWERAKREREREWDEMEWKYFHNIITQLCKKIKRRCQREIEQRKWNFNKNCQQKQHSEIAKSQNSKKEQKITTTATRWEIKIFV